MLVYFKDILRKRKTEVYKFQDNNIWLRISSSYCFPVYTDIYDHEMFSFLCD